MAKIIGKELANIPWQEKPQDYPRPVWRYTENPIIDRYAIPTSNSMSRFVLKELIQRF